MNRFKFKSGKYTPHDIWHDESLMKWNLMTINKIQNSKTIMFWVHFYDLGTCVLKNIFKIFFLNCTIDRHLPDRALSLLSSAELMPACFLLMFPSLAFICLSGTRARVRQSRWMPDWSSFLTASLTGITRCAHAGFYVPLCSWGRPELEMSKPLLKPDNLRWAVSFEDLACAVPLKKNANSLKCRAP